MGKGAGSTPEKLDKYLEVGHHLYFYTGDLIAGALPTKSQLKQYPRMVLGDSVAGYAVVLSSLTQY